MSEAAVERLPFTEALLERLGTLTGVKVYDGEIPIEDPPPVLVNSLTGDLDPAGRIAPYVVLFGGSGTPVAGGEDLASTHMDLTITFLLHAAAAYSTDCQDLADRVHGLLFRWTPSVDGYACSQLQPPPGYDPGPARENTTLKPVRFWLPMQYRLNVSR